MADIHVLEGSRVRGRITKQFAFHYLIPVGDRVAEAAQDPILADYVSIVPDIADYEHPEDSQKTELDAIKQGILVEIQEQMQFHHSEVILDVLARVQTLYSDLEQLHVNNYIARYERYLQTTSGG